MNNVELIEKAVQSLPPADLTRFRNWFTEFDAAAWDEKIEADAAAGKLDALAAEAFPTTLDEWLSDGDEMAWRDL